MTIKINNNFKIRLPRGNYKKLTKDLEDYIDCLSLQEPGDGEEILEILAKHGVSIEQGQQRVNFILCGNCGGVLYKTKPDFSIIPGWILACSQCENKFYPLKMECMDEKHCKELIKEEQVLNDFDPEEEEKIKNEFLEDVDVTSNNRMFDNTRIKLYKKGK